MEIDLREKGWFLSSEGIAECEKACNKDKPSLHELSKAALNLDFRHYGTKHLPDDINRGKLESVCGPMVLQVQKLRNISAPKANEDSNHSPRLLKIQLTDGHLTCHGLEIATIPDLSLSIPPGTKVSLTGTIAVKGGFLMLDASNTKVLGGEVEKLKEKWELNKTLAKHSRMTVTGEGPPPFVPFGQGKQLPSDNKGKAADKPKVNGVVQNSVDKSRNSDNRELPNSAPKAKSFDNGRNNRSSYPAEQRDSAPIRKGGNTRDERSENRRTNFDRANNYRHSADGRTDSQGPREKGPRALNSESLSQDKMRLDNHVENDRQTYSRVEQNEKPFGRGQPLRTQDGNRGGGRLRGGRGGRREPLGRGRPEAEGGDDSEDYRSRQPSDPGTIWDFIYQSSKLTVKDSKGQKPQRAGETEQPDEVKLERPPPKHPAKQESDVKPKRPDTQDSKVENNNPPRHQRGDAQGDYATPRDADKPKQESTTFSYKEGRQQSKPQQHQHHRHSQNVGQGRGKGSRRHDHNDSRPYNQSLPPRLQRKQQQQQQRQQQQHQQQHHHQHHQHHHNQQQQQQQPEAEADKEEVEAEYPSEASLPSVAQEDEAILRFSAGPAGHQTEYGEPERQHQGSQPVRYHNTHANHVFSGQQGKRQKNFRQQSDQFRPQDQMQQQYEQSYTPSNMQQQQLPPPPPQQQPPQEYVHMVMSSQGQQPQFAVSQSQQFVGQGGREQTEVVMAQEYHYAQQAQHPVQPYPVYQLRPAQMAQPQMAPQQTMAPPQQSVANQMPATQVGWKKGDHCLALWRDGQFYSAKMEDVMHDGVNCMVSFLDFHNSCEIVPMSSLRSYPIIAWGESNNAQPQPTGAVTAVPYYTQPAAVSIVQRPQVVIPVTGQPPFHAGSRPPGIPHPAPVPTQVHWQPAQVQYQEVRPAFQPVMHYGAVPQASSGGPGQAVYGVATGAGVHYVRGMKDTQGQDIYRVSAGEGVRGGSSPNSGGYSKPRRPNNRPTQSYYAPPRQQKSMDKG